MKKVKIAFVRNYTIEPFLSIIRKILLEKKFETEFFITGYDDYAVQILNHESKFNSFKPNILVVFLWPQGFYSNNDNIFFSENIKDRKIFNQKIIDEIETIVLNCRKNFFGPILLANFPKIYPAKMGLMDYSSSNGSEEIYNFLNNSIKSLCLKHKSVFLFDLESKAYFLGYRNFFDPKQWHLSMFPFMANATEYISIEISKFCLSFLGLAHKLVILDADNTLWGGIIGEERITDIKIGDIYPGSLYKNFQNELKLLKQRGIILALCSKNNKADIEDAFIKLKFMPLNINDFVTIRANWKSKNENILSILKEINISANNALFIDDSPHEIELVSKSIEGITTCLLPKNPSDFINFLYNHGIFDNLNLSSEDLNRTKMYEQEHDRINLKDNSRNYQDYLQGLGINQSIKWANIDNLQRLSQLTQKTNQFNTTTLRLSEFEIEKYINSKKFLVLEIEVNDKFGNLGIVGFLLAEKKEKDSILVVLNLLFSCRSLGRGIENATISLLKDYALKHNYKKIKLLYSKTKKNYLVIDFFNEILGIKYDYDSINNDIVIEFSTNVKNIHCPNHINCNNLIL